MTQQRGDQAQQELTIERDKTAVLIMDYQNRQLSGFTEAARNELLGKANAVLDRARQVGILVIYIEVRRGEKTPETEIHSGILPKPGELVLTKQRYGPFTTTNVLEVLKSKGVTTLALMGISTSGCVLSAVRWAADYADVAYRSIVLSDCCGDRDEEVQRVLIGKVLPVHATVVTSEQFLKAIGTR